MGKKTATAVSLILALCLWPALPGEASASRYTVTQCGWHVGQDASWADTSANKFTRSYFCRTPASADPFDGVHLDSVTRASASYVAGHRFARWRWQAPAGTGIVTIRGQRWHVLRDGFQHRIGSVAAGGGFTSFLEASNTDPVKRDFAASFSPFASAIESRLLCAKDNHSVCGTSSASRAAVRGLTITIDDSKDPTPLISGGLTGSAWLRGTQSLNFSAADTGSGLRFSETRIDGALRARTEHPCSVALIAGQWRGTKMQPCATRVSGSHSVPTAALADGPHRLRFCAVDFAGNYGCAADRTVRTDNTAPAAPRGLAVAGGETWRKQNSFELTWRNPDQGAAAPIIGFRYRVTGPGYVAGPASRFGSGPLTALRVPRAGVYRVSVWLLDAAGNENPAAAAEATIRLDDVPPSGYFLEPEADQPELLRAPVADTHSGVAGGYIAYRRTGSGGWHRISTELVTGGGGRLLQARFPSEAVEPGTYEFEVRVLDLAGNGFVSGRRGNGSPMRLRAPVKDETSLTVRLRHGRRSGLALRVPFGESARLAGRLTGTGGHGLPGKEIRITESPDFGALARTPVIRAETGAGGYFSAALPRGASRKVSVRFDGTPRLMASSAGPVELKVKGSLSLRARPRHLTTGQRLKLRGRVRSRWARRPDRGNLVAIQYLERSSGRWRPVLVTRTGRHGNFHARYRFRYITGRARIRLRAVLLPSQYFPYEPARSKTVKVEVRG